MSCVQDLLEYARIQPVMNQIEVHPYMRNDYNIGFCRSKVCMALPRASVTCARLLLPCRAWAVRMLASLLCAHTTCTWASLHCVP